MICRAGERHVTIAGVHVWLYHDSEYVTWCEPHFMYRLAQKHHLPLLSQYSCPYILLPVTSPSVDRFSQLFHWRQIYKRVAPDRNKCGTVDLLLLFSYTFFRLAAPSVKQVRFKPGVKESGSYGWAEWWIKKRRYDGWKNRWVGNGGTATRMRLMTRWREFILETRWSITKGAISCY